MAEHGLDGLRRCWDSPSTERVTAPTTRSGVARCARQLQGLPAAVATQVRAVGRWRRQRAATVPDGTGPSVGRRHRVGSGLTRAPHAPQTSERVLAHQLETGLGCAPTSSMGRLFDTVVGAGRRPPGGRIRSAGGDRAGGDVPRRRLRPATLRVRIDPPDAGDHRPGPVVAAVSSTPSGVAAGVIGARFHRAVADLIVDWPPPW